MEVEGAKSSLSTLRAMFPLASIEATSRVAFLSVIVLLPTKVGHALPTALTLRATDTAGASGLQFDTDYKLLAPRPISSA